ncbi:MAG: PDDEXK nuclease domain-containing protein [Candidatus Tritonobacter lacicola]|nr:PDDEXK nuclease domain-containing protein [Candidatus Tritonobacter lacicola]
MKSKKSDKILMRKGVHTNPERKKSGDTFIIQSKRKISKSKTLLPKGYASFLEKLKRKIRDARIRAALASNRELILLYWRIGKDIVKQQKIEGWGKSVVTRLGKDLQREFPGIRGFSGSNLWRMRAFYLAYEKEGANLAQFARDLSKKEIAQLARQMNGINPPPVMTELPWFHNVVLIEKLKDPLQRLWYAGQAVEHGWARSVLIHQIETKLYRRQGKALTNFPATLPAPQSDLAQQLIKDPYNFGFLSLGSDLSERQLEQALLGRIKDFLLELGKGFSFVGQQQHLEVGGEDYYLDLIFYHLHLRCFIVIDLKVVPFKPEFAGKMNFYLSAVDDLLRYPDDQPSIGLILCKERNRLIVEYALRDTTKPMGVATYRVLPSKLKAELPSAKQIEDGIKGDIKKSGRRK